MPLDTKLSEFEKGKVIAFKSSGLTAHPIATKLNRSKTVIYNFLNNHSKYRQQRHTCAPLSVSLREKRMKIRL